MSEKAFSLYDIEEFLREAGAEKINDGAVISLEQALENTVIELIQGAKVYANYAGREEKITESDIALAEEFGNGNGAVILKSKPQKKNAARRNEFRTVLDLAHPAPP